MKKCINFENGEKIPGDRGARKRLMALGLTRQANATQLAGGGGGKEAAGID